MVHRHLRKVVANRLRIRHRAARVPRSGRSRLNPYCFVVVHYGTVGGKVGSSHLGEVMEHKPQNRQRSPWSEFKRETMLDVSFVWSARNVNDGRLIACVGEEPQGWHLSISFRNHRGDYSRYPTWDEIMHARTELLPADRTFVMFLPASGEYVNAHETTFHLHEFHD